MTAKLNEKIVVELIDVWKSYQSRLNPAKSDEFVVRGINLQINRGEFFTLLGPSGCGKTTTLRMIGGFEFATRGELMIAGSPARDLPAHVRPVNTVFQSYALFPHMSVTDNVGFGLTMRRVAKAERTRRIGRALELVRMQKYARSRPSELSGGQQQRIALARALVNEPSVLLLDEPLGALDLKLRKEMQIELKQLQRELGMTFIFVTHDQEEALTMSDRIAVMHQGTVLQVGTPSDIYEFPTTKVGASFIGEMNFVPAKAARKSGGGSTITSIAGAFHWPDVDSGDVTLAIRPEVLSFDPIQDAGGVVLAFNGRTKDTIYIGTDRRYVVELSSGQTLLVRVPNSSRGKFNSLAHGRSVSVYCRTADVRVLPN
ncbi:ABC transporter ATP-binding protein [Paraburkholderia sp. J8-2]|uniref:ABC transporter ATP-binding protein n=1 Tax=Paraburkholderia sp. J8-2 TaxID=2805440 RepID=UPI002AB60B18|nr:ABC transporter ATP-binding protein [Paraburkholderia sp. J8-2]